MHRTDLQSSKLPEYENELLVLWGQEDVFQKTLDKRAGQKKFVFYDGPPTANGKPGLHHLLSRSLKDCFCRYKTMQGYLVARRAGWDCHGLPVELEVEKKLGLKSKKEVESYGVAAFNEACDVSVETYLTAWEEFTHRTGYWVDLANAYRTSDADYMEREWALLAHFHRKGLLYKGYRVALCCPRCETPLSAHEVDQGYQDKQSPSLFVRFTVADALNESFLVWTTTPWTLPANVALAVNPKLTYVLVSLEHKSESGTQTEFLWLAEARLTCLKKPYTVLKKKLGSELVGQRYLALDNALQSDLWPLSGTRSNLEMRVVAADYVNDTDGTGVVHQAPAYGPEDYKVALENDLPVRHVLTPDGNFPSGKFYTEVEKEVLKDLKVRGFVYRHETLNHAYPHCWRCKSPLLHFARNSWYLKTTEFRDAMLMLNSAVQWVPEGTKNRFKEWLEGNVDWAVSRDRYWGTPLPVWVCDRCGKEEAVESRRALSLRTGKTPDDLHRPFVDAYSWSCQCSGTMRRTPEVVDCWFDSGAMPFAQGDSNTPDFPADLVAEGVDQTRGWFYTLLAVSTMATGVAPYKTVLSNDLVLDAQGKKMAKSQKNTVDPMELVNKYGADVARWYLLTSRPVWQPLRFNERDLVDVRNRFFGTLLNVYQFYATYANLADENEVCHCGDVRKNHGYNSNHSFTPHEAPEPGEAEFFNRWLYSKLYGVVRTYTEAMEVYDTATAGRVLTEFVVEDLSKWYVRRMRRVFENSEGSENSFKALKYTLQTVCKLMAPLAPFLPDTLFRALGDDFGSGPSVHLQNWPALSENNLWNQSAEEAMELLRKAVNEGHAKRSTAKLKVRQPLASVTVTGPEDMVATLAVHHELVMDELNVKQVRTLPGEFSVELDTELTPELVNEGLVREFTRSVQNYRKEQGLKVGQRVRLQYSSGDLSALVKANAKVLGRAVYADLEEVPDLTGDTLDVGDKKVTVKLLLE